MSQRIRTSRLIALISSRAATVLPGLAVVCVIGLTMAQPAAAQQDPVVRELVNRVERLQREVQDLQRQVATGGTTSLSGSAGTGDAGYAARVDERLAAYDSLIRELTGRIETMEYELRRLGQQLQAMQAADQPPRVAEQGMPQTDPPQQPAGPDQEAGSGPRVLGVLTESDMQRLDQPSDLASEPEQPPQEAVLPPSRDVLPDGTAEEQYGYAFGLLRQAQWERAEQALEAFVDQHPDDPLAGNAMYWLGETHYVRQDYARAARVFADGYQRYPEGGKAADNLLKLGMALGNLGHRDDACGTLSELQRRYPEAPSQILLRAETERDRLGC